MWGRALIGVVKETTLPSDVFRVAAAARASRILRSAASAAASRFVVAVVGRDGV